MDLIDQEEWDRQYAGLAFSETPGDHPIRKWIDDHFRVGDGLGKTCLEIGCFPGRYLELFGAKGYRLEGIDLTPRVRDDLPAWLKSRGCSVGAFYCADFRDFQTKKQYDVVCSFGFIEHFMEWETILEKHCALVRKGGILILETPNIRGLVQYALRWLLDGKAFERHNLEAAYPDAWQPIIERYGFQIRYKGCFGAFRFWSGNRKATPSRTCCSGSSAD
jgi:2-polyprenyl-3-methyl-5-hydroxy-6-metoxy-1,4-benzoquinol methylase